jgi:hypothetical protein
MKRALFLFIATFSFFSCVETKPEAVMEDDFITR